MYFAGFSLDNLSLMALTIGTGFVVDDAIVMIENIVRHMENGESAMEAALTGAREIGFTVISLTVSLIAVFIPLLFMYIVLGVLYESLLHPLTIISTLPSAGLGALLALQVTNSPLTIIAFVGIILLIGIVKKNGIMPSNAGRNTSGI